jgi:hypothetical protein
MNSCKNCKEPVDWNYCPNCGQPAELKKIDKQYIIQELGDFFLANRGLIYTVKRVLISPGESVKRFLTEDRYRFVKPITFLFIASLIYTLVNHLFSLSAEDYHMQSDVFSEDSTAGLIMSWMTIDYPGYANIIAGLFVAFWIKLFFKKSGYNLFVIFILICFTTGVATLFTSFAAIIQGVTHLKLIPVSTYAGIIYIIWAIGQFFDRKKAASYIKAFLSFILGSLVLGLIVIIVGVLIDVLIIK